MEGKSKQFTASVVTIMYQTEVRIDSYVVKCTTQICQGQDISYCNRMNGGVKIDSLQIDSLSVSFTFQVAVLSRNRGA